MSISIVKNEDMGVLEVTYSQGTVTSKDLAEQRDIVAAALLQSGIRKVLLDASSLEEFPSILTALEHNESIAADVTLRKTKFAVICSVMGHNERSLETTGVNRGVHIKCFITRKEAIGWLSQ